MATHFDPYSEDAPYRTSCGIAFGENSETARGWAGVSCKRCLRMKERLQADFERNEAIIVAQMGEMAAHLEAHNTNNRGAR
jgi:hypothetical protein